MAVSKYPQTSAYDSSHLCFKHWQFLSLSVGQAIQLHLVALTASKAVVLRSPKQGSLETSTWRLSFAVLEVVFWTSGKKLPTNVVMNGKIHFEIPTMSRNCYWHGEREREREIRCIIFVWISYMSPIEALFFQWGNVSIMLLRLKHVVALGTLEKA